MPVADHEDHVPRFQDDQQVYAQLGGMFEDVLADDAAGARLRAIGGTVQWELRKPAARITVRLGDEETPGVDCGATQAKPEVTLSMDADTAHRFWAGELPMHVALSRGLIRAKGPVATILRIVPVVGPAKDLYAARIAGGGAAPETPAADEPEAPEQPLDEAPEAVEESAAADPAAEAEAPPVEDAPAEEPAAEDAPAEEPAAEEAPAEEPATDDAPAPDPAPEDEAPSADEPAAE